MLSINGRIGSNGDVAKLVRLLAGDQASFINGAVPLIASGLLAWRGTLDVLGPH